MKGLYTPKDVSEDAATARPGKYPYRRGIHKTMYTERLWTMRQFAGFGTAKQTNERFRQLLDAGQTGLSVAFDVPTLMGLDSSDPLSFGEIGKGGVAIDTLDDMERLFAGINLDQVSTSMTINGPAIVLLAMYFELARKQDIQLSALRGTIQNDPFKEFIAQKEWIVPPEPSLKLLVDTIEYCTMYVSQWNPVSISGYHIREAGSNAVQEIAFTLADGIAYVEACIERGMDVDSFAPRLSFFFNFCNNWIEEIAKIRAARVMWARIMREHFGAKDERSWKFRVHVQTSGYSLTQEQPLNNIARVAIQALGAILAGVQSLHTNSYDEQLSLPTEEAAKTALRTQQIIAHESGITDLIDAIGGSDSLEARTDELIEEALRYISRIDDMGGMIEAIGLGFPQAEISETSATHQLAVARGDMVVVGQNKFNDEAPSLVKFKVDDNVSKDQIISLQRVKERRNEKAVVQALGSIEMHARQGSNCMNAVCEAVRAYATIGEICKVLQEVYGTYTEKARI